MSGLLALVAVALAFLFSGLEAGVFAINRLRIRQLVKHGDRRAAALNWFLERPEELIWTILVGNTLASFGVIAWLVVVLGQWAPGLGWLRWILFVGGVFVFYAVCELMPKMIFRAYPNRLCLALARPFRLVHLTLAPLVWLVSRLTRVLLWLTGGRAYTGRLFTSREELRVMMQESAAGLSTEERSMIDRVFDLQKLRVRQVMTPLDRTITVGIEAATEEMLRLCRTHRLTRLPVVREHEGTRRIVGIVSLKRLLYDPRATADGGVKSWVQPAQYLGEDLRLEDALGLMRRSGQRLSIVLGRGGKEIGVISPQDILGVIFGKTNL
jgi:CBS domain containing-hemolysin-like protein